MAADELEVRRIDVGAGIYVLGPPTVGGGTAPPAQEASRRAPAAALALGAGLAAVALMRVGVTAEGLLAAGLLAVLTALAAIDLRARVLPNRILGPAMVAVLVWQLVFFTGRVPEVLLSGLGAGVFLLLPSLLQPGAMGMGDVKLATLLGLALGTQVVAALMVGLLAAVPVALVVLVVGGSGARRKAIPFGPFLALGAAAVVLM
jgi:leader peptidase (prepilin peptidase) / N-methyltransferase